MIKRKQAIDLTDLALAILVLGIVVTVGANILIGMRNNRLTDLSTLTATNETTWINRTTDTLANVWGNSVIECRGNFTGAGTTVAANTTIPSTNYTVTTSNLDGTITLENATSYEYNDAACTYTYYDTTEAQWALPNEAASGLSEYGNWFDIIVIVGIAGIILALIFMAFGNRTKSTAVRY